MLKPYFSFGAIRTRLKYTTKHLTTGGDWAVKLPERTLRNMRAYWFDGFFAAACDNIVVTYLVLYLLALGATRAEIGLMSSLTNLAAALLLIPGAMLVERIGHRMGISLAGGAWARIALVLLALLPLAFGGRAAIILAIILSVSRDAMSNLAFPAWMAITGDICPIEGRGRFFASRNLAMGAAGMLSTLLVGWLITRLAQPAGYQYSLALAFGLGMVSTYSFAHIKDQPSKTVQLKSSSLALPALVRELGHQPGFAALCATAVIWNFSLNVAGPFFTVHLVQGLGATPLMVALTSIASSLSTLLVQPRLGILADKWGPRRMQMISGLLIPIVPFMWVFATAAWNVIFINIISGVLWGAYSLSSFNYLLALIPEDQRARYSAFYQVLVMVSLSIGAAVGGLVVTRWGMHAVFIFSSVGRLVAAVLFARFVHSPRRAAVPATTG